MQNSDPKPTASLKYLTISVEGKTSYYNDISHPFQYISAISRTYVEYSVF